MPELSEKARLVADRYEEAYFRANGKEITVRCTSPGWYTTMVIGGSYGRNRYRLSEIEEMTKNLEKKARENDKAAERTGFIVKIAPPRTERDKNMTERYLTKNRDWTANRANPTVHVFEGSHEADSIAREFNEGLPFKYAEIETF